MSWLNFNDSLNNLKGQISNFASNVLAEEDQGTELNDSDYKKLQELCIQQEFEIKKLRQVNEELNNKQIHDASQPNGTWNWNTNEEPSATDSKDNISDLRRQISVLEHEKSDLMAKLEQLDADNQENLVNIMQMKEKLQYELNDLNENYLIVKEKNKILMEKEQKLKNEDGGTINEEYVQKCKDLAEINQKVTKELEELQKELIVTKHSNETLQKILEETKDSAEIEKLKKLESENKLLYSELKKANEAISFFEKKSLEDEENCNKLARILETYEKQVSSLKKQIENYVKIEEEAKIKLAETSKNLTKEKEDFTIFKESLRELEIENENLKKLNEDLIVKATGRMDRDLENELEDIQQEHEAQLNVLREELEQLKQQESKNRTEGVKFEELEEEKLAISRELKDVQDELDEVKNNHKISLQGLHDKYISIITENIKKFQDCEKPSDFQHCIDEYDPQVVELSKHVENIMKILLDLKCKCGELESRILELAEEKNNVLIEKNREIEKLIQNSDVLSQEILAKTQSLKEYENECKQMAKNNELLIAELESFKNNPMLQTISESNEDSMILMEAQLENASKRIEDLEKIIDDLERNQIRKDSLEDDSDWENAVKKLNNTEEEIDNKKKDYQELLNNFDGLQVEFESSRDELEKVRSLVEVLREENEDLKGNCEKLKIDYENTEYQLSELNINCESLKEEIEDYKKKLKVILVENTSLKLQNENYADFESKINFLEEKLAKEESQLEVITEKLKNAKMNETSIKLQYEQKNKELAAQTEERYNLELALKKLNSDLAEFQNNFVELQNENDKLMLQQEEMKKEVDEKEGSVKVLEKLVEELKKENVGFVELQNENDKLLLQKEEMKKELDEKEESVKELEKLVEDLKNKCVGFVELQNKLLLQQEEMKKEVDKKEETVKELEKLVDELKKENVEINGDDNVKLGSEQIVLERDDLRIKLTQVQKQLEESKALHQQVEELTNSRNELINMVTAKHQENVTYHNEIQRLNQVVTSEMEKFKNLNELHQQTQSNEEIEKLTDQNGFLKEKCEVLTKNLLEEQSRTQQLIAERSEKELTLQKKVDRLQGHLIELEEHYTEELLQAEQKNSVLVAKVSEMEEREKNSSTIYTSVNIRANQQVESLQSQLQGVVNERDSLRKQISDAEDENSKQAAALANLQFVLEQFRKDKEKDVMQETERIRRHINTEKQVQEELRKEIGSLKLQLEERTQGLLAASRISDQLESAKKIISGLKDEVSQLQYKLTKTEEELGNALSSTDGKVDKLLIKNLIMGFVLSNNNMNRDQEQVLKIISSVLDFNQQDHEKLKLNKPQQGWLSSLLAPNPENKMSEESLSKAFIQFLENESRPRVIPSLLDNNTPPVPSNASTKSTSSTSSTPRQTPIVLSEIVLPTFTEFAQNRNSSSILKDVLKDNS